MKFLEGAIHIKTTDSSSIYFNICIGGLVFTYRNGNHSHFLARDSTMVINRKTTGNVNALSFE